MEQSNYPHERDLRSGYAPTQRQRKAKQKYLGYGSRPKGTIGQPCVITKQSRGQEIKLPLHPVFDAAEIGTMKVVRRSVWTKTDLWENRLSDIWPLNYPHHYGRCRGCHTETPGEFKSKKQKRRALNNIDVEEAKVDMSFDICYCTMCLVDRGWEWDEVAGIPQKPEYTSYVVAEDADEEGCGSVVDEAADGVWDFVYQRELALDLDFELVDAESETLTSDDWSVV